MRKLYILILTSIMAIAGSPIWAEEPEASPAISSEIQLPKEGKNWFDRYGIFNHLEAGLTLGTTGIGLELAVPVTKWVRLRAGYDYMPHFHFDSSYDITAYSDGKVNDSNFGRIQQMMRDFSGFEMRKSIVMENTYTLQNWKVLADIFPIPNNDHWRVTVGLYGGSRIAGRCINKLTEAPMLVNMAAFNHFYDVCTAEDFVIRYSWEEKFMGLAYLDADEAQMLQDKMKSYGRLGVNMGYYPDGTPYFMEPDENGSVSAKAIINEVRPYIGVGYEGALSRDKRWKAGVDAGAMFWGGAPRIRTHDGVDLNDMEGLRHKVKRQMDIIKSFPVYPVINFRLSYSFF